MAQVVVYAIILCSMVAVLVKGDAVTLKQIGDRIILGGINVDPLFWNSSWKLCMSVDQTDPVNTETPPNTEYGASDLIMLLGSDTENSEGRVEKVGIGVSTTDEGITSIEVVQTRRDVASGDLDIWISNGIILTNNDSFTSCIIHQEGYGNKTWQTNVKDSNGNEMSANVTNSIKTFHPEQPDVVVDKLDNATDHVIQELGVYGDCVQTMDYGIVCNSVVSSLNYTGHITVESSDAVVSSFSACTGASIEFPHRASSIVQTVKFRPALDYYGEEGTVCFTLKYEDSIGDGSVDVTFERGNTQILQLKLFNDYIKIYPAAVDGEHYTLTFPPDTIRQTICVGFSKKTAKVHVYAEGSAVVNDGVIVDGKPALNRFQGQVNLLVDTSNTPHGFHLFITDVNIYNILPSVEMLNCDYADTSTHVLYKWANREMVVDQSIILISRPDFYRKIHQVEMPLMVCGAATSASNDGTHLGSSGAQSTMDTTSINECYLDAEFTCDLLIGSFPMMGDSLCWSTTGVNAEIYNSSYYIGIDEVASLDTMMYKNYHMMPAMEYLEAPNDDVTYIIANNVSDCVDSSNGSTLITYNYMTKVCRNISAAIINNYGFKRNYYSSIFLPHVETDLELKDNSSLDVLIENFHAHTQNAFSMSSSLCVNGTPFQLHEDVDLFDCGRICLLEPECIYFQVSLYNWTDCALFSQEHRCDIDPRAVNLDGTVSSNPYLKRFNKKDCPHRYVLVNGTCIMKVSRTSTSDVQYEVHSMIELRIASAFLGTYATSVKATVNFHSRLYTSCAKTVWPGYYTTVDGVSFCDSNSLDPTVFISGLFLQKFGRFRRKDGGAQEVLSSYDTAGNARVFGIFQNETFSFPLKSSNFDQTMYKASEDDQLQSDIQVIDNSTYVNSIELYVWLQYERYPQLSTDGKVVDLGNGLVLSVVWDGVEEKLSYVLEIQRTVSGSKAILKTSLLNPGVWYMVHAYTASTQTKLDILYSEGGLFESLSKNDGLKPNSVKAEDFQLSFKGCMTCLMLFYNRDPLNIELAETSEFCTDTEYKFEDEFTNQSIPLQSSSHEVYVRNTMVLMESDGGYSVSYTTVESPSDIPAACSGHLHTTFMVIPEWNEYYSYGIHHDENNKFSAYLTNIGAHSLQYDKVICSVSSTSSTGSVSCWSLFHLAVPLTSYPDEPCTDECSYIVITFRDGGDNTLYTNKETTVNTTTFQQQDCHDYCECSGVLHWARMDDQEHILEVDGFDDDYCSCSLRYTEPNLEPMLGLQNSTCSDVCPHWERGNPQMCDCETGAWTEVRNCVEPANPIGTGMLYSVSCTAGIGTRTLTSTELCSTTTCPALQINRTTCVCSDGEQIDYFDCIPAGNFTGDTEAMIWTNAICDPTNKTVQYYDKAAYDSGSTCDTICPASFPRPCCVSNQQTETNICEKSDQQPMEGFQLTQLGCIEEAACNTDCLHVVYHINCTSGELSHNLTGTYQNYTGAKIHPHWEDVCESPCDAYSNWIRVDGCPFTTTTTPLTTTTTPEVTTTSVEQTTTTVEETTTTVEPATTTTVASTTTAEPSTTTAVKTTTSVEPTSTPMASTTTAIADTTSIESTSSLTTNTTTTSTSTTTSTTTTTATTTTTTRPETYTSCSCKDGKIYSVEGDKRTLIEGDCSSTCPHWSVPIDYCFCAVSSVLQHARTCEEGSNPNGYLLDAPFICNPKEIQTNVTALSCTCPEIVEVDQCDCKSGYGRIGEECHYHHPKPIGGVCSAGNVLPYICKHKCSRYGDWSSWSTCTPCGIGNENGTHTRSRDCIPPANYDANTDYMGSEICTTTDEMTSDCSCGYIWSQWGSCDCSSGKQQRNRCYSSYELLQEGEGEGEGTTAAIPDKTAASTTLLTTANSTNVSTAASDDTATNNKTQDAVVSSIVKRSIDVNSPWCISDRECSGYCPYYSTEWSEWEKCNCLQSRRFQECIYPNNPDGMNFTNQLCTEPLKETKGCNDPGCYSDWSEWTQCLCDVSQSSRSRDCLDNICSEPLKEYQDCQLNELVCWQPWSTWSTCLRADNNCGRGGIKNRTRTADCSSTPNLSDICSTKTQTEYNKSCISYTCTKYGEWGEWEEWNGVKLCGMSNQTRVRNCEYSYRTIQSWSHSTCDADCWQCIVDESEARCTTDKCKEKSCYRDQCMRSCFHTKGNVTKELNLTFKCKGAADGEDVYLNNIEKGKREVSCGTGNTWTEWTACGITCGNQWGKRYRSQKCDLTEDEKISELCKNVFFLQVEPEWCFGKGKCPEIKIVPTLIPEGEKAKNLPPKESKQAPVISATIFFVSVGSLMMIIVLDIPSLILEIKVRLITNVKSMATKNAKKQPLPQ